MITAQKIGLRYDGGPEVISDASFQFDEGSFHYLTGPSGSGKTSLMRMLHVGKLPSRGVMTLFGTDIASASRNERAKIRRKIGVIFQTIAFCRI